MRIVVPIKQILDPAGITVRRDKERLFVNREDYIIGPGSKAAIEAALRIKDAGGAEVIALSVGQPRADDALREALAMGCDGATLLSDSTFEDADISVTARILAATIQKLGGADLVVAGRESGDTGAGQIGPRLAEALDYALVTDICAVLASDGALLVTRRWGSGQAKLEVALPAVVTVAPEAFPPRYAHGARIMNAYRKWQVATWDASDLRLGAAALASLLTFRGESFPPPLEVGERFEGDSETVASELVMTLRLQGVLA
jgi:electron transfer flavoprotein beta subunit